MSGAGLEPAVVTGASGFVGGALVRRLRAEGRMVRALGRSPMPELAEAGAECIHCDITDLPRLTEACRGAATVFHVAARVGVWGPRAEFERTNIEGTRAVLAAARAGRVRRLVFTSSPSVVFDGSDLAGVDESQPLGSRFSSHYPRTKAAAERLVLAAHDPAGLRTLALRPHLVFGPGDRQLLPRVVARARAGRLRVVGSGRNRVDLTFIDNVVDAHLLADSALARADGIAPPGGRAYFITNGEPVVLWEWINELLRRLGLPPVSRRLGLPVARVSGALAELVWAAGRLPGEPPLTRFVAAELASDHWFDIAAAERDLGYRPRVSMAAALEAVLPWLRQVDG